MTMTVAWTTNERRSKPSSTEGGIDRNSDFLSRFLLSRQSRSSSFKAACTHACCKRPRQQQFSNINNKMKMKQTFLFRDLKKKINLIFVNLKWYIIYIISIFRPKISQNSILSQNLNFSNFKDCEYQFLIDLLDRLEFVALICGYHLTLMDQDLR